MTSSRNVEHQQRLRQGSDYKDDPINLDALVREARADDVVGLTIRIMRQQLRVDKGGSSNYAPSSVARWRSYGWPNRRCASQEIGGEGEDGAEQEASTR